MERAKPTPYAGGIVRRRRRRIRPRSEAVDRGRPGNCPRRSCRKQLAKSGQPVIVLSTMEVVGLQPFRSRVAEPAVAKIIECAKAARSFEDQIDHLSRHSEVGNDQGWPVHGHRLERRSR
jgi:hypothetical protein